ncbi:MAG: hypothetical protein FWH07_06855 [Oscillospiraceae bacterium]|nr:hypothetical protein [Oscillospiraceae bacterium]
MRIHKSIVLITLPLMIISLVIGFLIESDVIINEYKNFLVNICIGVFASAILSMFISVKSYLVEKRNYYITAFTTARDLICDSISLIEQTSQKNEKFPYIDILKTIEKNYFLLRMSVWNFCEFFKRNQKDNVIDATMVISLKILKLYNSAIEKKICIFDAFADDMLNCFIEELNSCQDHIDSILLDFVEERDIVQSVKGD